VLAASQGDVFTRLRARADTQLLVRRRGHRGGRGTQPVLVARAQLVTIATAVAITVADLVAVRDAVATGTPTMAPQARTAADIASQVVVFFISPLLSAPSPHHRRVSPVCCACVMAMEIRAGSRAARDSAEEHVPRAERPWVGSFVQEYT
jgi:hypothetical protein